MAMNPMQRKANNYLLIGIFGTLLVTGLIIVFLFLQLNNLQQEQKKQQTFNAIVESGAYVRRAISQKMHIRTVPEFRFKLDGSMEYGAHIDELLEKIKQ